MNVGEKLTQYETWQCQQCGASIGYLGHFLRGLLGLGLYGRLIGCRYCLQPQSVQAKGDGDGR
jgi:hypothetical protein